MPKNEIDYSHTIIYKIYCKDQSISDVYVGHTTSFIKRKYQHKLSCNNLNNNLHIYKIIRENGGWDNWEMVEIDCYNCKNSEEARIKEQQHYEVLKCSLNSVPPYVDKMQKYCKICKIQCNSTETYNAHIETNIHKKKASISIVEPDLNANLENPKNPSVFFCETCDFKTRNKKDYSRHLITDKHKKLTNLNLKPDKTLLFHCICGKFYKHSSSLCGHKKKCTFKEKEFEENNQTNEIHELKEFMKYLMKENSELKTMMMKVMENGITNNSHNNNTHTNSHNKAFNLNFFLNETCKDAMNIMDFVDSIKLQLSDLENVGKFGYVEGISNIIVKNLNDLDVTERPIHCTDKKRETLYIKDEDKWEKEDEEKKKIKKVIKHVANKNVRLIKKYKEVHPDCIKSSSKFSDQYDKIIVEAMGGSGDNDAEKEEKIIQRISKNVTIDKEV